MLAAIHLTQSPAASETVEATAASFPWGHVIGTAVLIVFALALRFFFNRKVRASAHLPPDIRRRWIVLIRRGMFLAIAFGLVVIWASELRIAAVSLLAIAVAIVIALKELLMCASGAALRAHAKAFDIGDRIEVKSLRGDVIDHTILTTTILELGPGKLTNLHTGRALTIPNSIFLTEPVGNETFTHEYVLHVFSVPMRIDGDWRRAEQALLQAANQACAPYLEDAREHMAAMGETLGLASPSVEPRVSLQFPEPDRIDLVVRMTVPARRKGRLEQVILRRYADEISPRSVDSEGTPP